MPVPTDYSSSAYQLFRLTFGRQQVAINQAAVQMNEIETRATTGTFNVTGYVMPYAGSIVGVTIASSAVKSAGTLTVTPTIGGTAITAPAGLVSVALANAASTAYAIQPSQQVGARFAAGSVIGAKITTDGTYAPTTNDVQVEVWVIVEGVAL